MGRAYAGELEALSETYEWAVRTPIRDISEFVKRSAGIPLYVLGSGGSLSAATLAAMLHQHTGTMSKSLTPLEFLEIGGIDGPYAVLIVTARGNNGDVLAAFDRAVDLEPDLLGVICASTNNKITSRAAEHPKVVVHAAGTPTGKDGFLATNSLMATMIWLVRAYADSFSFMADLPKPPKSLLYDGRQEKEFDDRLVARLQSLAKMDMLFILHDSWGRAAAVDAESKLVEAGLVGVQLADYRNFAHGRHNWLDKNAQRTGVITLTTPKYSKLADKTIKRIPDNVPVASMSSDFDGPTAALNLLVKVMYIVKFFGTLRGIDPGMPKVAEFGRRIYHIKMPSVNPDPSAHERVVLQRKFTDSSSGDNRVHQKVNSLRKFVRRIERTKFGGIVLDYDGTMCDLANRRRGPLPDICHYLTQMLQNKILVGVATGRGRSVRKELQKIIPDTYWHDLLIGYYNGGNVGYMDDDTIPDHTSPTNPHLCTALQAILKCDLLSPDCQIVNRPSQISLRMPGITLPELMTKIDLSQTNGKVRVVESSHSIDIIMKNTTKINLLDKMRKGIWKEHMPILCIGDRGRWPGNDFDLLNTEYSLSVDEVSDDMDSCWNVLPLGIRGEAGTLKYIRGIKMYNKYFMINMGVKQ